MAARAVDVIVLAFIVSLTSITSGVHASMVAIMVTAPARPLSVSRYYGSVNLDWWHSTNMSGGGWGNASILSIDLDNLRLRNAAAALAPGLLRIGGSEDILVKYYGFPGSNMTRAECNAPTPFRGHQVSLCMTKARWDAVNAFIGDAGLKLVFGISFFARADGSWDSANALNFVRYTAHKWASNIHGFELGEEMAPEPSTPQFAGLVAGYATLRGFVRSVWPTDQPLPRILGPCVGMADEDPVNYPKRFAFMKNFLDQAPIDDVCFHSYNNDGGDNWNTPGFLAQTGVQARGMLAAMAAAAKKNASALHSSWRLWCGECGPHNEGGLANKTDRFLSSFWYADALGGLARLGLAEFGRQSLAGAKYEILNQTTFAPNPDFYILLAWKKVMGTNGSSRIPT